MLILNKSLKTLAGKKKKKKNSSWIESIVSKHIAPRNPEKGRINSTGDGPELNSDGVLLTEDGYT